MNVDQIATTTETGSTCHWLSIGQDINIQFKKSLRLVAVTLETETPYKCNVTRPLRLEIFFLIKRNIFAWPKLSDEKGTNYV